MAKNSKRKNVGMVSTKTGHRTYITRKNPGNTQEKLNLMKYDPIARERVLYKETTKNLGRNEA